MDELYEAMASGNPINLCRSATTLTAVFCCQQSALSGSYRSCGLDEAWLTQKPDGVLPGAQKACPLMRDSIQRKGLQELVEAALLVQKGGQQAAVVLDLADELQFTQQFEQPP